MKRELKRKTESPKDFTARNIISSIDKQVAELEKNNLEIDTILGLLKDKKLSDKQEENIRKALNSALELSSNIQNSLKENFNG